jgi:hypothetical protein
MKPHKSDSLATQPRRPQLRPHKTTTSLHQMYASTRSVVQDLGYTFRNMFFDTLIPVEGNISSTILGHFCDTPESFYEVWNSATRMTYRRNWPEPFINPRSGISYDSDTGWGCTIRSAQMLLSHVLENPSIALFSDEKFSPFGIHAFLSKSPSLCGEWFGPTSVSLLVEEFLGSHSSVGAVVSTDGFLAIDDIVKASQQHVPSSPSLEASPRSAGGYVDVGLLVPTVRSTDIGEEVWFIDEQENLFSPPRREVSAKSGDSFKTPILEKLPSCDSWHRAVLILVAIRLSATELLPPTVLRPLLAYMSLPSFAGLLGGPDRRCHYIVGYLTEKVDDISVTSLIALDPHVVQEAVTMSSDPSTVFLNAPHPLRVSPESICPSIALSFMVRSESEVETLRSQIDEIKRSCPDSFSFVEIGPVPTRPTTQNNFQVVVLEDSD